MAASDSEMAAVISDERFQQEALEHVNFHTIERVIGNVMLSMNPNIPVIPMPSKATVEVIHPKCANEGSLSLKTGTTLFLAVNEAELSIQPVCDSSGNPGSGKAKGA